MTTLALFHPGEMGTAIGVCARDGGAHVAWTSAGRSEQSVQRASVWALAAHEGVESELLVEWGHAHPDALRRRDHARNSARKAWRWAGEMDEIAATFRDAGLPDGFHLGASEVFRRLDSFRVASQPPSIGDITRALNAPAVRRR